MADVQVCFSESNLDTKVDPKFHSEKRLPVNRCMNHWQVI